MYELSQKYVEVDETVWEGGYKKVHIHGEVLEKVDWGETVFLNHYFRCWKREILSRQRQKKTFAAIIINQHMTSSLALRCEAAREGTQR